MAAPEAENQIRQMTQFIANEAKDRAEEIGAKALQEFSVEKLKIVNATRSQIRQEYERKAKQIDTQNAIARSTAINKARLEKIRAREDALNRLSEDSKKGMMTALKDANKHRDFITNLIVQGLLMLLETDVQVRCRDCDNDLVRGCLGPAMEKYTKAIEKETGTKGRTCNLSLDTKVKLPPPPGGNGPSSLGGVVLACNDGTITIDNTIDSRLALVLEQTKPTIRTLLFGS